TALNFAHLRACLEEIAPLRPDGVNFAHLSFITDEMAAVHNALYAGEMQVAHSCLGEMDLRSIDPDRLAQEIADVKAYARGPARLEVTFHPDLTTAEQLARYYRE